MITSHRKQHNISGSLQQLNNDKKEVSYRGDKSGSKIQYWFALSLCCAVMVSGIVKQFINGRPAYADSFAPVWISVAAAVFAAAGIIKFNNRSRWLRVQRKLLWSGILLMVWTANGLPFDLLRLTPLMPQSIDWPGMVTRMMALVNIVMLAHIALTRPDNSEIKHITGWYGYPAFVLALPYPVHRICWAFGGTIGLTHPGAAGNGFTPLIIAILWILAAILSLLLVSSPPWMPRQLLLAAGWTATIIVAMIGPAAFWMIITSYVKGGSEGPAGMAGWIPLLIYSSWFLFAITIGAATRSYQLRTGE